MGRSAEVEQVVREMFAAFQQGVDAGAPFVAEDATMIGTDPSEYWSGREEILRVLREQFEALGEGFGPAPGSPIGFQSGDVGWFDDVGATFLLPGSPPIPIRASGVLMRSGGSWQLAAGHFSIGVSNEEVLGQELPTG
jgi:hypothetical protein